MKSMLIVAVGAVLALVDAAFGAAEMAQTFRLVKGWNAVHVQVAETNDVDMLFRDWPVEWVALYDSAAFLETRQFSAESSNEGVSRAGYRMWRRSEPGLSGFRYVPADSVIVCYASEAHDCAFYGEPRAPRITWHKSGGDEKLNLVGFSTSGETTTDRYFSGLSVGDANFFIFGGEDTTKPMVIPAVLAGETFFANAQVLAVSSTKVSDWSGVLNVSPRNGLAFDAKATKRTLEVRNDGAANAVVTVRMSAGSPRAATDFDPVPPGLFARDSLDAATNGPWTAFTAETTLRRELLPGERWEIAFAIDLLQLVDGGAPYGAILVVRDETPDGSAMRVNVPLTAVRDGALEEYAWPRGVWSAAAELDEVNFVLTSGDDGAFRKTDEGMKKAGGRMTVRLPLYVDDDGKMTLLQRLWFGRNTNGVLRAFSGAVETSDEPLVGAQRLSTPFLPTDQPRIAFSGGSVFGRLAVAAFTVGEKSNVNPMRHAQHPQHDGLTADYGSAAPSGDDFNNYVGLVKPETFSISNRVSFVWDENETTRWNPAETLTGTLTWEFDGLRHEGTVRASGKFVMKRLSPVSVKME